MGNKSKTDSKLPTEKAGKPNMSKKKLFLHLCGPKRNRFRSAKQTATAAGYNCPLESCLRGAGLKGSCQFTRTLARVFARSATSAPTGIYTPYVHTHRGGPRRGRARGEAAELVPIHMYTWAHRSRQGRPAGVIARRRRPRGRGLAGACPCPAAGCRRAAAAARGCSAVSGRPGARGRGERKTKSSPRQENFSAVSPPPRWQFALCFLCVLPVRWRPLANSPQVAATQQRGPPPRSFPC